MRTKLAAVLAAMTLAVAACGGDDGSDGADGSGDATLTVYATNNLKRAMPEIEAAFEESHPDIDLEVVTAPTNELQSRIEGGDVPDVYIGRDSAVSDVIAVRTDAGAPEIVGRDVMAIVVPAGNPAGVASLAVFGDDPVRSGLCAQETPCGSGARLLLERVGVDPAPDVTTEGWLDLAEGIASSEIDAGLLYRTEFITKLQRIDVVPLPDGAEQVIVYEGVTLTDSPNGTTFLSWLVEDPAGNEALRTKGLRTLDTGTDGAP